MIDAYDEALLRVDNAAQLLVEAITEGLPADPAERDKRARALTLRVTSRAGVWPRTATQAFEKLWGEGNVRTLHLAPLRRADAALAAAKLEVDADAFLHAVTQSGAGAWAAHPLSLFWLVELFRRHGRLPHTRAELFHQGALLLCEERNVKRVDADRLGLLEPEARLTIAARVAALMRFGERATLSFERPEFIEEGGLAATDVYGLEPIKGKETIAVGRDELRDVARDTGLFRSVEQGRFRWSQEAIADYLAAWYLRHRALAPPQTLSLVAGTVDRRVAPQLRSVAGWVVSLDPDVFDEVVAADPHIVLEGDPRSLREAEREAAVEALLTAIDEGRLDTYYDGVGPLHGLDHLGLEAQLLRWMGGVDRSREARREAVWLAAQARLHSLAPALVRLALDQSVPTGVRTSACYAVSHLDRPDGLSDLRELALDETAGEGAASLRRAARAALWPHSLSFRDLAASATLDRDDSSDITDAVFYKGTFDEVDDAVLADALDWVDEGEGHSVPALVAAVLLAAARRVRSPEVGRRLARLLVRVAERDFRFGHHLDDRDMGTALAEAEGDRSTFLTALIAESIREQGAGVVSSIQIRYQPFRSVDVALLVEHLVSAETTGDEETAEACKGVLSLLAVPSDRAALPQVQRMLRSAAERSPRIADIVYWEYGPWDLEDPRVLKVKEYWTRPRIEYPAPPSPPIPDQIRTTLSEHNEDPVTAWREACYLLTLDPKNGKMRFGHGDYAYDLTKLDAWSTLDKATVGLLAVTARRYLDASEPQESDWEAYAKPNTFAYRVVNGVKALWLLAGQRPELLDALDPEHWAAWASALLLWPVGGSTEDAERYRGLVARAYEADPEGFAGVFERALPLVGYDRSSLLGAVEPLGAPSLEDAVSKAVEEGLLSDHVASEAADHLVRRGHAPTLRWAAEQTRLDDIEMAGTWAMRLVRERPREAWQIIEERFTSDDEFARRLLVQIASRWGGRGVPPDTPDAALVTFERRLHELFPPEDDPPRPKGVHSPTTDDEIRDLRGSFSASLARKGTGEALAVLQELRDVLGDETTDHQLRMGAKLRREHSHASVEPAALLALADDTDARLARSPDELFAVVVETLEGFEDWLQTGDAPRVEDLWNRVSQREGLRMAEALVRNDEQADEALANALKAFREGRRRNPVLTAPKDERALADLVLRFLRERLGPHGVLVAQEANVKRGHETDLYVSRADDEAPEGAARVVIEVKASWNTHLYTAIRDQLAQGYLDGVTRRHGIYLVGWYGPAGWYNPGTGEPHPKAKLAKRRGFGVLGQRLDAVAATLSIPDRRLVSIVVDASLPSDRASA